MGKIRKDSTAGVTKLDSALQPEDFFHVSKVAVLERGRDRLEGSSI